MFSQEKADAICLLIAEGKSLRAICQMEGMPEKSTVFRWLADEGRQEFRDQYARAREVQADTLFEDVLEISDDARNDWMEVNGEDDRGWRANGEHIQRSRLRVDARKWMASKLAPKKYGEKVVQEHTGADGGPIKTEDASDPNKLARAIALLLAEGAQ